MSLLSILIVFIFFGVVIWLINEFIPMPPNIKRLMNIVAVIVLVIWLLYGFGVIGYLGNVRI